MLPVSLLENIKTWSRSFQRGIVRLCRSKGCKQSGYITVVEPCQLFYVIGATLKVGVIRDKNRAARTFQNMVRSEPNFYSNDPRKTALRCFKNKHCLCNLIAHAT